MIKIRKAIVPAAGWGTRFLPANKAIPKEMLPIVDKPIIQYVVEEVVSAGIRDIIIILTPQKQAIRNHFGKVPVLEKYLQKAGKKDLLKMVQKLANLANFTFINQSGPYGNGTPVLNAQKYISNEPFAMLWGDDFIYAQPSRLSQILKVYEQYQGPVVNTLRLSKKEDAEHYGMAKVKHIRDNVYQVESFVEKPGYENRPSEQIVPGGSILTPDIFPVLKSLTPGKSGEIWLIDAINKLIQKRPVYACEIQNGTFYDCGNKLEYLKTVVEFALRRDDIGPKFRKYLQSLNL